MKDDVIYGAWEVGPVGCIPWTLTRYLYLRLPISKLEIVVIPYVKKALSLLFTKDFKVLRRKH